MSAQDRYKKIVESLVNDETDVASELLHEAFVEKARDIWNDLLEQDEILEDEIEEQEDDDLEEAIRDEESADFLDDIEQDEEEIDAEEAFGEDDADLDAEMELAEPEGDEDGDMDDMDMDDGDEAEGDDVQAEFQPVQDALEDLKATFAELMGDDGDEEETEEGIEETPDDEELTLEADDSEDDDEVEELDEAELKKVGKDNAVHPIDMPAGDDGKASPVGPGIDDPFSSVDGAKDGKDMGPAKANEKGGKAPTPAKMDATSPQDAGDPKPAPKPKG